MKQTWQRMVLKIDALSLRERAIIFVMAALVLVTLVNAAFLNPQFDQQKKLSLQQTQDQAQIAALQAEIGQKLKAQQADPDAPNRARLQAIRQQLSQTQGALQDMQKGLVPPEKMTALLEDILKKNGRLQLVSLKTLPVTSLSEAIAAGSKTTDAASDKPQQNSAADSIYKHDVEIVLQGGYLDMMSYMAALEAMPWQLFWSRVKLNVDEYPKSTLTLTLFTLSLDKKWLNL